jgi:V-type H+-transporting ATPase subunit a
MMHGTLVLPVESARDFVDMIGANANIQLEDMNKDEMVRPYRKYIQRIDEMERILRFLTEEVGKVSGPKLEILSKNLDSYYEAEKAYKLDEVEPKLQSLYVDFTKFQENTVKLTEKRNAVIEERFVTETAIIAISHDQGHRRQPRDGEFEFEASQGLLAGEDSSARAGSDQAMFNNIAGVIPQEDQQRFARTLFRATRGNTFTHFQQIGEPMMDPRSGKPVQKSVFVVYYQDSRGRSDVSAMAQRSRRSAMPST